MNVELPDGTILEDIPEGTTRADLMAKLSRNGYDVSKLGAPPQEDYGNEGRRAVQAPSGPAAQKSDGQRQHPLVRSLRAYGDISKDMLVGMGKGARDFIEGMDKEVLDASPGVPLDRAQIADPNYKSPEAETLNQMYDEAGPAAGVGKFVQEVAMTAGPSAAVGKAAGNAVRGQAPKMLRKALGGAAELATSGAAAGALLPPGEGETRGGNALQGAATSLVAGPVLAGGAKLVKSASNLVNDRGVDKALGRAGKFFEKTLGKGRMQAVTNNLDLPQGLPMSTAAAGGRDELMSLERLSRARANPVDSARWGALDARTKGKAWERLGEATGDDLAKLQPRAEEAKATLVEAQNALNGIQLKAPERQALADELLSLRENPAFENNTKAQRAINDFVGNFMRDDAKRTVGGLAHFETDLAADTSLSPKAREAIWGVIRKHIDANGGGAWSEAYNLRQAALKGLDESKAANAVVNDFQDAFGGARGKTTSGEPILGSTKLQASLNKRGTDSSDPLNPRDVMNPDTRQAVQSIVDDLRRAEAPVQGRGGSAPDKNPWGSLPMDVRGTPSGVNYMIADLLRKAGRVVYGQRTDATQRAADLALRSPQGWRKMLEQLDASKELNARDAAMVARILRATGPVAGAVNYSED